MQTYIISMKCLFYKIYVKITHPWKYLSYLFYCGVVHSLGNLVTLEPKKEFQFWRLFQFTAGRFQKYDLKKKLI